MFKINGIIVSQNGQPLMNGDKEQSAKELILMALSTSLESDKGKALDYTKKLWRIHTKIEHCNGDVQLKSESIEIIKQRCHELFHKGVFFQIAEIFDGNPTQAQLDEV